MTLTQFVEQLEGFGDFTSSTRCDYFVLFLTTHGGKDGVLAKDIEKCFTDLRLPKYSNIPQYLSKWSVRPKKSNKKGVQKFVLQGGKYHLERTYEARLKETVVVNKPKAEVHTALRGLLPSLTIQSEREFLQEVILCFEVEAYRAATILAWILTIDHLQNYILNHKLTAFNIELAKVTDKRIKVSCIAAKDDFTDIPENKFIELCRASSVITNDVRKILDEKLGTRNSVAHPSSVALMPSKALDFVEDLVHNVILKY